MANEDLNPLRGHPFLDPKNSRGEFRPHQTQVTLNFNQSRIPPKGTLPDAVQLLLSISVSQEDWGYILELGTPPDDRSGYRVCPVEGCDGCAGNGEGQHILPNCRLIRTCTKHLTFEERIAYKNRIGAHYHEGVRWALNFVDELDYPENRDRYNVAVFLDYDLPKFYREKARRLGFNPDLLAEELHDSLKGRAVLFPHRSNDPAERIGGHRVDNVIEGYMRQQHEAGLLVQLANAYPRDARLDWYDWDQEDSKTGQIVWPE